jgi:hypothetical protein
VTLRLRPTYTMGFPPSTNLPKNIEYAIMIPGFKQLSSHKHLISNQYYSDTPARPLGAYRKIHTWNIIVYYL